MKIVFCNGQPPSGSTFCFQLVVERYADRHCRELVGLGARHQSGIVVG